MVTQLLLVLVLAYGLVKSTDLLVVGLRSLAEKSRVGEYFITTLVLAMATSLPELAVAVVAAAAGEPVISLGNVIGSNVANLTIVAGGAAAAAGSLVVAGRVVLKDIKLTGLVNLVPLLLISDAWLSRADGIVLLTVYFLYIRSVLRDDGNLGGEGRVEQGGWQKFIRRVKHKRIEREVVYIFTGAGLMLVMAHLLVVTVSRLAEGWGISLLVVGMLVVALGTSLPEFALSVVAIRRGDSRLVFGNLLGSVVANASLILGITALITPFGVVGVGAYSRAVAVLLAAFVLFYIFTRSRGRLSRLEGLILVGVYLLFLSWEIGG